MGLDERPVIAKGVSEGQSVTQQAKPKVAVIGGTGYGGAELIRLLMAHPGVDLVRVTSIDSVDEPLEAVHLNLTDTGLTFENISPTEAAKGVDLVFLALPHKVSATMAPELMELGVKIVDLSGDYRLRDAAAYQAYYGLEHPNPEHLDGRWVYGLPELNRADIKSATRVASPGCFATTIALGLLPLARAGLLQGQIQTVAATGSSGSGAYAKQGTHHPLRVANLKIYKPMDHQHTPEIEQTLRLAAEAGGQAAEFKLNFVPISAPLQRGILANSFVEVPADLDASKIGAMFDEFYAHAPFVRVLTRAGKGSKSSGRHAEVVAIKGSMWVDLSWTLGEVYEAGNTKVRQLVVTTALDNLVKGGAGQAVSSMNLMLGFEERHGIDHPALWP